MHRSWDPGHRRTEGFWVGTVRYQRGSPAARTLGDYFFFFFFITLDLELSDTKVYEP
jgi:hypothetical protein